MRLNSFSVLGSPFIILFLSRGPLHKKGGQARIARLDEVIPGTLPSRKEGVQSVQIKISARHGHLSDANQQFIRDKAEKLLHYFQRIMMIEVLVDFKEDDTLVEFLVSAEDKH